MCAVFGCSVAFASAGMTLATPLEFGSGTYDICIGSANKACVASGDLTLTRTADAATMTPNVEVNTVSPTAAHTGVEVELTLDVDTATQEAVKSYGYAWVAATATGVDCSGVTYTLMPLGASGNIKIAHTFAAAGSYYLCYQIKDTTNTAAAGAVQIGSGAGVVVTVTGTADASDATGIAVSNMVTDAVTGAKSAYYEEGAATWASLTKTGGFTAGDAVMLATHCMGTFTASAEIDGTGIADGVITTGTTAAGATAITINAALGENSYKLCFQAAASGDNVDTGITVFVSPDSAASYTMGAEAYTELYSAGIATGIIANAEASQIFGVAPTGDCAEVMASAATAITGTRRPIPLTVFPVGAAAAVEDFVAATAGGNTADQIVAGLPTQVTVTMGAGTAANIPIAGKFFLALAADCSAVTDCTVVSGGATGTVTCTGADDAVAQTGDDSTTSFTPSFTVTHAVGTALEVCYMAPYTTTWVKQTDTDAALTVVAGELAAITALTTSAVATPIDLADTGAITGGTVGALLFALPKGMCETAVVQADAGSYTGTAMVQAGNAIAIAAVNDMGTGVYDLCVKGSSGTWASGYEVRTAMAAAITVADSGTAVSNNNMITSVTPSTVTVGVAYTLTFTAGAGAAGAASGDAISFGATYDDCDTPTMAAAGTVTSHTAPITEAVADSLLTAGARYICYKNAAQTLPSLQILDAGGPLTLTVLAATANNVAATFATQNQNAGATLTTNVGATVTMALSGDAEGDKFEVITAACGSTIGTATTLSAADVTNGYVTFTAGIAGTYKVCYQQAGRDDVTEQSGGASALTVAAAGTTITSIATSTTTAGTMATGAIAGATTGAKQEILLATPGMCGTVTTGEALTNGDATATTTITLSNYLGTGTFDLCAGTPSDALFAKQGSLTATRTQTTTNLALNGLTYTANTHIASISPTTATTGVALTVVFTPTTTSIPPNVDDEFTFTVDTVSGGGVADCSSTNPTANTWAAGNTFTVNDAGTYYLCYKVGTNAAQQTGITLVVTDPAASCAVPTTTAAPASGSADADADANKVVKVTITFDGTYDASMTTTSSFATGVKTAMASSICNSCTGDDLTAQEGRIEIISIAAGSIVVVSEVAPASGQTIAELDTAIDTTLVADVTAGDFSFTVDGVTYNATAIETDITTSSSSTLEIPLEVLMALALIIGLAVGIPCFCCCVAVIVFFKCIKGKNEQQQGQQQGATQFV
jgi:hypothetical protein